VRLALLLLPACAWVSDGEVDARTRAAPGAPPAAPPGPPPVPITDTAPPDEPLPDEPPPGALPGPFSPGGARAAPLDADGDGVPDPGDCDDLDPTVTACLPATCAAARDAGLPTGLTRLDPDGPEAGLPPFEVHCDQDHDGGGWALVLTRAFDDPCCAHPCALGPTVTTVTEAPFGPADPNLALPADRFAALRAHATEARALASESHDTCGDHTVEARAPLELLESARCAPLSDDLSPYLLAHDEPAPCDGSQVDYDVWLGGITPDNPYATTLCNYGGGVELRRDGVPFEGCSHGGSAQMVVR
jgi:hypothetical protein